VGGADTAQNQTTTGKNFAGVMRDLLPTHERQKVAALKPSEPSGLKSETLGEQIEVITAKNSPPDADSLTAFARAQGLDESAVMALFGQKPNPDLQTPPGFDSSAALSAALLNSQTTAPTTLPTPPALTVSFPAVQAPQQAAPLPDELGGDVAWLADQLSAEITVQVSALNPESPSLPAAPVDASTLTTANWLATLLGPLVKTPASSAMNVHSQTPTDPQAEQRLGLQMTSSLCTPAAMTTLSLAEAPADLQSPAPLQALALPTSIATLPVSPATSMASISPNATLPAASLPLAPLPLAPLPLASLPAATSPAVIAPAALSATAIAPNVIVLDATARVETAQTTAALNSVENAVPLAPATPAPQDVMRIRLVPAWENVSQQLHQLSGTAVAVAWGALTASSLGGPIRSVALDLRTTATLDDKALEEMSFTASTDNNMVSSGADLNRTTATGAPLPTAAQALPGMANTLRQEHYQQLADRLGQAMAERLQSQIARGEWKLQMRLNPASLGRIDVELDMHAKGLDAVFRSDNPLTRELMAQSIPKLKDSLTQSGMAVASVWVNSDAGRQSGGNPTPQRESAPDSDNVASAHTDTAPKPVAKEKRMPDGFDVLA
jgi:flagellar hook-length control protein FliK